MPINMIIIAVSILSVISFQYLRSLSVGRSIRFIDLYSKILKTKSWGTPDIEVFFWIPRALNLGIALATFYYFRDSTYFAAIFVSVMVSIFFIDRKIKAAENNARLKLTTKRLVDQRNSILFLRQFTDDQMNSRGHRKTFLKKWIDGSTGIDECVQKAIRKFGVLFGYGDPSRENNYSKLTTVNNSEHDWRNAIVDALKNCKYCIYLHGDSAGLKFEYSVIRKHNLFYKVLEHYMLDRDYPEIQHMRNKHHYIGKRGILVINTDGEDQISFLVKGFHDKGYELMQKIYLTYLDIREQS